MSSPLFHHYLVGCVLGDGGTPLIGPPVEPSEKGLIVQEVWLTHTRSGHRSFLTFALVSGTVTGPVSMTLVRKCLK